MDEPRTPVLSKDQRTIQTDTWQSDATSCLLESTPQPKHRFPLTRRASTRSTTSSAVRREMHVPADNASGTWQLSFYRPDRGRLHVKFAECMVTPPLVLPESEHNFAYRYGKNGRRILPPPTVTDFPLRDDFDAITVADKSVLNRASWKDETGSVYDAFEYMVRYRNVPRDSQVKSNDDGMAQREVRPPSRLKPQNSERGSDGGRKRFGGTPRLGQTELVEERVLEDGPTRTISVWREQVATDTIKQRVPPIHIPGATNGRGHRRTRSDADGQASGIPVSTRLTDGKEIISRARNMSIDRSSVRDRLVLYSTAETHICIARPRFSFEEIVRRATKWSLRANSPAITSKSATDPAGWPVEDSLSHPLSKTGEDAGCRVRELIRHELRFFDLGIIAGFVPALVIAFVRTFTRVGDSTGGAPQSTCKDARGDKR